MPAADLVEAMCPGDFVWGTAVADRSVRLLLRYLHQSDGDHDDALQRLSTLTTRIAAVRDHVEKAIKSLNQADGVELISTAVVAADAPRVLGVLVDHAIETYTAARGRCTADRVREALLAMEIVTHTAAGHLPFSRPARFDFVRMGPDIECPALPSSNGNDWGGERKLYGRQLLHFGAFGSREWRQHDYVWGRLDGAAHLVRLLAACTDVQEWKDPSTTEQQEGPHRRRAERRPRRGAYHRCRCREETQTLRELDGRGTLNLLRECANGHDAIRGVATDVLRTLLPGGAGHAKDRPVWRWTKRRRARRASRPLRVDPWSSADGRRCYSRRRGPRRRSVVHLRAARELARP